MIQEEIIRKELIDLSFKRKKLKEEKAALEYAKGIQKKFDTNLKKLNSTDDQYLKELDARG